MKRKLLLSVAFALTALTTNAQTSSSVTTLGSTGMTLKIETSTTLVTLTLTGSNSSWLGIGFGGTSMSSATDMFIWNSSANRDYTPSGGQSTPSADASQSWTVTSDTVSGSIRTVVATRALVSSGDYTFTNTAANISIIYALGSGTSLGSHSNRGSANITRVLSNESFTLAKSSIYPNPSNGNFTIETTTTLSKVAIYTLTGSFVKNIELNDNASNNITVEGLSSGIYLIELSNDTEKTWKKIVIE